MNFDFFVTLQKKKSVAYPEEENDKLGQLVR
jgi:hypothetical protein